MNNQQGINTSLDRVIKDTFFTHRGTVIERMCGGWRCLGKKFTKWDELDKHIDETLNVISESIKKGQS